jgi:hypothetical protein
VSGVKSASQLLSRANGIFTTFLQRGAKQAILVDPQLRQAVQADIQKEKIGPTLFQACQEEVRKRLREDSFEQFLQSKHFQRAMLKLVRHTHTHRGRERERER